MDRTSSRASSVSAKQEPAVLSSSSSSMKPVPQFLTKLYKMTNNPMHRDCLQWNEHGSCFWVSDIAKFSRDVLPTYFKHNNYASFVRQLNMYGFHRNTNSKGRVLPGVGMVEKFSNPNFLLGRADLLCNIRRKASSSSKRTKAAETPTPMPSNDTTAGAMVESRLVALERQVQFLHLQNQALASQSARQREALAHLMQMISRMTIGQDLSSAEALAQFPAFSMQQQQQQQQQQHGNPSQAQQAGDMMASSLATSLLGSSAANGLSSMGAQQSSSFGSPQQQQQQQHHHQQQQQQQQQWRWRWWWWWW